ncbi:hypothetical protein EC973_003795 [Apophysomyces ossiformis]|uniref:Syntaxin n=1 Tax=Apophysomyces ossiformis TaxID=679940 RepID=A0A8H7ES32_9FUNG|nr:hypothetical protein EC973_003795 [Apophysomyces ossiformis]
MTEVIQAIYIRDTETRNQPKPHTVYKIEVHAAVRNWTVWKRYSDFTKLDVQFHSIFPKHPPPTRLPSKRYFPSTFSDPDKIDNRRRGLEDYLRSILSSRDDRWRQTEVWKDFLSIPSGRPLDAATMYTSSMWLDEYNALANTAQEIRSLVNRRGTHIARNEISESHNCMVQAKKLLLTLTTRLGNLEAGLTGLANGTANEPGVMSEGELRRRQDMLGTLKEEKETLVKLISTGRQERELLYSHEAPQSNTGDRNALLESKPTEAHNYGFPQVTVKRNQQNGTIGRGRVFGAAAKAELAKETETTRGLDNEGLLAYQQQVMTDQDQQVEQFSAILSRQKQLGMAISHELETHNQLLEELDGDVGRTQTKLKFSQKKLSKMK